MSILRTFAVVLFLFVGSVPSAYAAIFAVGTGDSCGYSSLQQAIDAERVYAGPNDLIYLSRTIAYNAQAAYVHDQSLTIMGGFDDCGDYTPSGTTTVSGAGGAAASVFTIRGNTNLRLAYLTITQGDRTSDSVGGGIDFQGYGTLEIDNSRIFNNRAGYGAGMNVNGTNNSIGATVDIGTETLFSANTAATSGGGIRIEGKTLLHLLAPQTWIANNHADGGFGGGLQVISPAHADLGSPGYDGLGLMYSNTAKWGGGLAVNGTGPNSDATVRLFTTDPTKPLGIEGNTASSGGGGVYVDGYESSGSSAGYGELCGTDYRIDANSAPEGSAIYGAPGIGTFIFFQRLGAYTQCGGVDAMALLGAVPCTSTNCNLIDGNVAQDTSGVATTGSPIAMQSGGYMFAERVRLRGNRGSHVVRSFGAEMNLQNCLVDANLLTGDLFVGDAGSYMHVLNCTIAGNQIATGVVLRSAGEIDVTDSIIGQGENASLVYTGGNPGMYLTLDYILSDEVASLAQGTHIIQGIAQFVDAPNGDYRLRPDSPAIDRAPAVAGDDRDLDDRPHDQDIVATPDGDGVRDLGAYERQIRYCGASDTIFCNNFQYD